jgi:predicted permease
VLTTVLRLLPVAVGMGTGFLLRRLTVAGPADGEFVFKLVFYVCLPALMFSSLSTAQLTGQALVFLLAAPLAVSAGYLAGRIVATKAPFTGTQIPVLLIACMMVNSGFELPFVQALYGAEGVARIAAFDAMNTTLTFTWAYYTAARGNPEHEGGGLLVNRLLRSPPLYGIAAGLLVNAAGVEVPQALDDLARTFGSVTGVLISLGSAFCSRRSAAGSGEPVSSSPPGWAAG